MSKDKRILQIEKILKESTEPMSGSKLADKLGVSRQVIVQDISILRAQGVPIKSTYKGYIYGDKESKHNRVIKVRHRDDQMIDEMDLVVDLGAEIKDVFIWHRNYGKVVAPINAKSRRDVREFVKEMESSASSPLKNITDSYHYHTISADDEETLDLVEQALKDQGYWVEERDK